MADTVNNVIAQSAENLTKNANITAKIPATPEGMAIAYGSLIIMAVLPIFFGSYRSVRHHKEQQVSYWVSYFCNQISYVYFTRLFKYPISLIFSPEFS